jgi:hypothetical protein
VAPDSYDALVPMPFLTGFKQEIDAVGGNLMVQLGERISGQIIEYFMKFSLPQGSTLSINTSIASPRAVPEQLTERLAP